MRARGCKNEIHAVLMRRLNGRCPTSATCSARPAGAGCARSSCRSRSARRVESAMRQIEFLDTEISEVERLIALRRSAWPATRGG